ncbi:hypothetical protein B0F90DRAFT_1678605 [Multifurca ochricompacta]|uniref:Uncharacterized protein n=1 Tax=Multifurca ochricompacta TaxID=376703 RepID=A0AAD4ME69_9AGAM|nr:hypothetical protein B0F90DRAFT_1678605 [Multifurca ochricompacta]
MNRTSAQSITEEWLDADFDLTDDEPLRTLDPESDKDDVEDWDIEMDLGNTGGAKVKPVTSSLLTLSERTYLPPHQPITIRPPLPPTLDEDDEEEEGVSTIKMGTLRPKVDPTTIDEDFESAFALPSDLTKLSLRPLSHQSSKNSLEWGDKDQTSSSSQSSDTYSTLGFDHCSTSSTSTSLPETETEDDDEDDGELEGLVIPIALFESGSCVKQLAKILEMKKKATVAETTLKVTSPDPEDDIEIGLVIDDDADFSPSRLLQNTQHLPSKRQSGSGAHTSGISSRPLTIKPTTKPRTDRAKSPIPPPPASSRQLQKIRLSPSPPPRAQPTRAHSYQALLSAPATTSSSFLAAKSGSLRGQKSHSGLKPASPPSSQKRLTRKASLSSLMEISQSQVSGFEPNSLFVPPTGPSAQFPRYDAPTASSRAKTHTSSTSRIRGLDYNVPPTRPSTPSANPAALRLTMPTSSSRLKARPSISSVFPPSSSVTPRATSPIPPRPPSTLSMHSRSATGSSNTSTVAPKVLKKPKRQRLYGDGTELDAFDDLPTDRDKESQYRVHPKGYGSRMARLSLEKSIENNDSGRGTVRKKSARTLSMSGSGSEALPRTLKRTGRIELPPKLPASDRSPRRKKVASPSSRARRKPTLIRNLGSSGAPKTVGEMRWNPQTLRWEGNDQALRGFDAAMVPTRPALITHLTGSSVGSPVGPFASGARRVGNMIFDPGRMCWISTLSPEDDEPDVFADLADEGDVDTWEAQGGTIRAGQSRTSSGLISETSSSATSSRIESPSPARSRARSPSESGSDRGSRASMVYDVDDTFLDACRVAEERHRQEMRGWKGKLDDPFSPKNRLYLHEIRALATRKY